MRKISSEISYWNRQYFPWLSWIFVLLFGPIIGGAVLRDEAPKVLLLAPVILTAISYLHGRWLVSSVADEVYLDGEKMVVRKDGKEARFPIRDIVHVEACAPQGHERIALFLREPCALGRKIIFFPPFRWDALFTRHPIADELTPRARG